MNNEERSAATHQGTDYEATYRQALPELASLSKLLSRTAPPLPILRVNQIDAETFETEVNSILEDQFARSFSLFNGDLAEKFKPELVAAVRFIIHYFSVGRNQPHYGNRIENLTYRNEAAVAKTGRAWSLDHAPLSRWQRVAYLLSRCAVPYCWERLSLYATAKGWGDMDENTWQRKVYVRLSQIETAYKSLSLLNLIVFLYNGRYRSLLDRILRMRLVYIRPHMSRQLSFEYLNRTLVWHGFTEMVLFLMPMFNLSKIKSAARRWFLPPSRLGDNLPENECALCTSEIHVPYVTTPCNHVYCYYCLRANLLANPSMPCPRCGEHIKAIRRANYTDRRRRAGSSGGT